jgi:integrase
MPRRRPEPEKPKRRSPGTGSVRWIERRQRWRSRLPQRKDEKTRETWHLTRDEAEAWIVREVARDRDSFDPTHSTGDYLDYWLDLVGDRWGPQTRRRYEYEAKAMGPLRAIPLERLRGDRVQAQQATLLQRGLTRRYTYNVMALLRRALADAVKWKILPENVADTVTLPEPEVRVTQAWTLDEVKAVLRAITGHRFEACYLLILWGGLRIGEVVGLKWDQIADDGTVAFREAEHTHLRGRPIGTTKRERERETELPAHVVTRLKELCTAGPAALAWPGRPKTHVASVYVAQRPDGGRWHPRTIRDDWVRLVTALKVAPLRPHGGRRTFGTQHMAAGTPLADLASLMGHSSPAITAQSYLGSSKDRRKAAAERLADLLEPDRGIGKGQSKGQAGP